MSGGGARVRAPGLLFSIEAWHAWAPDVEDPGGWARWIDEGCRAAGDAAPDVAFLPTRLRQRLGKVGRMALATAWPCSEGLGEFAYVYGSRLGTLSRTSTLLEAIARHESLSPAYFSLSVHNAVAGLFAMARRNHGPATAISGGPDTLSASLLEAIAIARTSVLPVVMTYVEAPPPPIYAPLIAASPHLPFSISLRVAAPGADFRLRPRRPDGEGDALPQEAAIMALLTGRTRTAAFGTSQPCVLDRING